MTDVSEAALDRGQARHQIDVADETLTYRTVRIDDPVAPGR